MNLYSLQQRVLSLGEQIRAISSKLPAAQGKRRTFVLRFEQPVDVDLPADGDSTHGKTFFWDRWMIREIWAKSSAGTWTLQLTKNATNIGPAFNSTEPFPKQLAVDDLYAFAVGDKIALKVTTSSSCEQLEVEVVMEEC